MLLKLFLLRLQCCCLWKKTAFYRNISIVRIDFSETKYFVSLPPFHHPRHAPPIYYCRNLELSGHQEAILRSFGELGHRIASIGSMNWSWPKRHLPCLLIAIVISFGYKKQGRRTYAWKGSESHYHRKTTSSATTNCSSDDVFGTARKNEQKLFCWPLAGCSTCRSPSKCSWHVLKLANGDEVDSSPLMLLLLSSVGKLTQN